MKKYFIITIGCQMNKADSERVAGYLEMLGYRPVEKKSQANLVVITTCGVRQSAEDRVYGLVPRIKKQNPQAKIILTGCLSGREDVRKRLEEFVDIWLPIAELSKLASKLSIVNCQLSTRNYLNITPKYNSKISAFVPIGYGCNNFCAYCVVPYARGREVYRPAGEIIKEVENLVKKGYKEIVLIAQNVNSYASENKKTRKQKNKKIDFSDLLKLINNIPGNFWIRFATSHPKDISDKLIRAIAECQKICAHIHLPAQAGDNTVLNNMNRNYTREDYNKLVEKIRSIINDKIQNSNFKNNVWQLPVSITTDIIVGFPGETKKQFNNTAKLFKEVRFDMAYIAQYSIRPGTAAEKLNDNVPRIEKKAREEKLMKILRQTALENNHKYLGKTVEILVEGKNKKGEWYGKTGTSKNVKIQNSKFKTSLIGKFVNVKITSAEDFGLAGESVN
jgi:tRNA-2-methylthio-N6-dimethylallyladenosine synthase